MDHLRLLLDENIGSIVFQNLRRQGFDVVSVTEMMPGSKDYQIIECARKDQRIIVTFDKDFGTLVYKHNHDHHGVILLRLENENPIYVSELLLQLIHEHGSKLTQHFTVVTKDSIRIR